MNAQKRTNPGADSAVAAADAARAAVPERGSSGRGGWRADGPLAVLVGVSVGAAAACVGLAAAWTNRVVESGAQPGDWLPGLAVLAVVAVLVIGVAGRFARDRLRAGLAVGSALGAVARGVTAPGALRLPEALGPEARAWNGLIERRAAEETADADRRLEAHLAAPGADAGRETDLTLALDAFWQGLVLVDDELRIKYLNGAAAAFLGAARERIIGQPADQLRLDARVIEAVRATATGKTRGRSVVEVGSVAAAEAPRLADGESADRRGQRSPAGVLRFSVRPVRREDRAAAMVLIEDITQQRVADESRNQFVAQATHELRTPLTNIRLYVEQLIDDGESLEPIARANALNVISQESRRLERIVGDMLSVSEIEAGSLRLHDGEIRLAALLEDLKADYHAQAESKQITLAWDISPKLPVLRGDRDKLTLAVHNLLGNAVKYTPAGGKVSVRAGIEDGRAVLEFSDTGIGIDPREHELIFDRFYRAKDARLADITGSGLGLALAREVVRLHGGEITVRSALNQGSTFTVSLPLPAVERKAAA